MIHRSHPAHVDNKPAEAVDKSATPESTVVAPKHGGGAVTGAVHRPQDTHYDPAGKPIEFNSGSVRDQQAGGDLTGREPETRDDNFIDDYDEPGDMPNRQLQRDIGTGIDDFSESDAAVVPPQQSKTPQTLQADSNAGAKPAPAKKTS